MLYKYTQPERIDIIENLEIRFTQPGALNDPFELQPQIDSIVAEAEVLSNMPEIPVDLRPMVKQAYDMLPELQAIPFETAMAVVEQFMATEESRKAAADGLNIFLTSMREGARPVRERIYEALNTNAGILSLSELADSELMWAHYGASHTGFVLCFDELDAFFHQQRTSSDAFGYIRRVQYFDGSPLSLADFDADVLLITKRTDWSYEKEWRMLLPLNKSVRSFPTDNGQVYLFGFPASALRGVILGARASTETDGSIRNLLSSRPDLAHVKLERAILDLESRSVKIHRAD